MWVNFLPSFSRMLLSKDMVVKGVFFLTKPFQFFFFFTTKNCFQKYVSYPGGFFQIDPPFKSTVNFRLLEGIALFRNIHLTLLVRGAQCNVPALFSESFFHGKRGLEVQPSSVKDGGDIQPLTSIFGLVNSNIKKMRLECRLHHSHSMGSTFLDFSKFIL